MRLFKFLFLLVLTLMFYGCSYTIPQASMVNEEYIANADDFEIVGEVVGKSKIASFLGFGVFNDRGYHKAYQNALKKARDMGADDLICIYSDKSVYSVFGIYNSNITYVYAKAVKRK